MPWVLHDDFATMKQAKEYGQHVVSLGLAKGAKVKKNEKKKRKYELYINKGGTHEELESKQ